MKKLFIIAILIITVLISGAIIISWNPECCHAQVQANISYTHLSPKDFRSTLSNNKYVLLDIRTLEEFNAGHIDGSKQIDYYQTQAFLDYLDTLDKKSKYLIYCKSGRRSGLALDIFKQKGFANVWDLDGGYSAWIASGFKEGK